MKTTLRVIVLLKYISKTELAKFLEISRVHLYRLIKTHKWKRYQIKYISELDKTINELNNIREVKSVSINNGNMEVIYEKTKKPIDFLE